MNNEQRTTNNEQRTTNNEQRTTNNEQRTTNNEQRTTNNEDSRPVITCQYLYNKLHSNKIFAAQKIALYKRGVA